MRGQNAIKLILLLQIALALSCGSPAEYQPKSGDVVFQVSKSSQSLAIQRATGSKYSHMGMVFIEQERPFVLEAAGTVHLTTLEDWVARGEGGHFVAMRLKHADDLLDSTSIKRLRDAGRHYEGRPYDIYFEWSDNRIYCSELVWKIFKEGLNLDVGQLQRLGEFNLSDPYVKEKLKERFGEAVPLSEVVVSPAAMMQSEQLVQVYSR